MRILLAAAITALTRGGAAFGGISMPLVSSRAFGVGVQMSTSAEDMPPPPQFAEAPAGTTMASAATAVTAASPALSL